MSPLRRGVGLLLELLDVDRLAREAEPVGHPDAVELVLVALVDPEELEVFLRAVGGGRRERGREKGTRDESTNTLHEDSSCM
jgi:hypothetical protein